MQVKGVAFLARESFVIAEYGRDRWMEFMQREQAIDPLWVQPVLPVTRLPVQAFLDLNDRLAAHFFPGQQDVFWKFGFTSAEFALTKGQLKGLFAPGDTRKFLAFTPQIFKGYYDDGALTSTPVSENAVDLRITGTPRHRYFEESVMGFGSGGLTWLQAPHPEPERLKSFLKGDAEVLYRFRLD
jgi:hypothetical protein